ncbi:MAG: GNAT family N-acetyltransferase [Novosphingobium sp.]|nr:GNAT family N-acetyltransferase [Novosphingobium sp.]
MFIRSKRLFLRPCWPEDCEELFALVSREQVARAMPVRQWPRDADETRVMMERPLDRRLPRFLVTLPTASGQELIGMASLALWDGAVELFHCIAPEYRGRGYATEAVAAVLAQARALGHSRIVSACFIDYPDGARVLEKAGFRPTGATCLRSRHAHGEPAPAVAMAIELESAGGNDDPAMRAA